MNSTVSSRQGGFCDISISLPWEEVLPYLKETAKKEAERHPVPGFRPQTLPYDIAKEHFGELHLFETSLSSIVQRSYVKAVGELKLQTVGSPEITIQKFAVSNPLEFKAHVALLPSVTITNWKKIRIARKKIEVTPEEIEKTLSQLQRMQRKEAVVTRAATTLDKVLIDLDLFLNGVLIEGGSAKNHGVYMAEDYYIPGLQKELVGLKSGDEKEFNLTFPSNHYQKQLAGREVHCKVKVKEVFELIAPALDDAFAKTLGQKDIGSLRDLLKKNIEAEKNHKEEERVEDELMRRIVKESKFDPIPDTIIHTEVERMIEELSHGLEERGVNKEQYFKDIAKKPEDLQKDFLPQAEFRIKAALVLRSISKEETIEGKDPLETNNKAFELIKKTCIE